MEIFKRIYETKKKLDLKILDGLSKTIYLEINKQLKYKQKLKKVENIKIEEWNHSYNFPFGNN